MGSQDEDTIRTKQTMKKSNAEVERCASVHSHTPSSVENCSEMDQEETDAMKKPNGANFIPKYAPTLQKESAT